MKCLTRRIELDTFSQKKIGIFAFYDIHLGSAACDEERLKADIAGVKERGDWWIDGGDSLEAINRKDKRHNEEMMAPWLWGRADIITPQIERYSTSAPTSTPAWSTMRMWRCSRPERPGASEWSIISITACWQIR